MALLSPELFKALAPITTAVGAFGGFPDSPQFFKDLSKYEWFNYLMLYVLIYQGMGQTNPKTSLVFTIVFYLIKKYFDKPLPKMFDKSSLNE